MSELSVDYEMKKKRLCVISAVDITFKVLLISQIKAAQEAGYDAYGICSNGPDFDFLKEQGIKMFPVRIKRSISPFSDIKALWQIYKFFKKEKIDIIHAHTPKSVLLAPIAAKLAGVPVRICTLRGFMVREGLKPLPELMYRFMAWISAKCSTFLLCQNPEDVRRYIEAGVCKEDEIAPLGNGVDLQKFNPDRFSRNDKSLVRQKLGIPKDAIVIGIIGRLVKEKGYLELFEAFESIIKDKENVRLIIIGPEEPEKADRISGNTFLEYGIESKTKYLGSRDDIPELLSICDIYTLPSWREGFPRSAIEAAAMRLPIVTTNIRGCRQAVEDGLTGILVPVKKPIALANALIELIDRPMLRYKMGQAGFDKAQKEFNEKRVCQIVLAAYKQELDKSNDN
jgi:glycosyltransferase involved in cell wall biosynthesis